jgi:hypothetical protein
MPTDGLRAQQLKGRDRGGLHHVHAVRRWRFFATRAPRWCCAEPTTAAPRYSWSQDHRTNRRCYYGRGSGRLEEAGLAAIATRCVSASATMPQQAARASSIFRSGALPGRGHRQRSWDDSDAAGGRSFRAARVAQGARCARSYLRSSGAHSCRTATRAAVCVRVRGVLERVWGGEWVG